MKKKDVYRRSEVQVVGTGSTLRPRPRSRSKVNVEN
jgi:hypothetical protein